MNPSKFDTIIQNRANERVQKRIEDFRAAIAAAITALNPRLRTSTYYHGIMPHDIKADLRLVLDNVASGLYFKPGVPAPHNPLKPCEWPRVLWSAEEKEVEKLLMATMDEMQKALCAKPPETTEQTAIPAPV